MQKIYINIKKYVFTAFTNCIIIGKDIVSGDAGTMVLSVRKKRGYL